jgi:hypothetical protein
VYFGIFPAGTMPCINAVLQHGKPILLQVFPKRSIGFALLLGFGGQVKKYKHPHDAVFIQSHII